MLAKHHTIRLTGNQESTLDTLLFFWLLAVAAGVPSLVLAFKVPVHPEALRVWNSSLSVDFFAYARSRMILVVAGICLIILILQHRQRTIKTHPPTWLFPLTVYLVLALLSTLFSVYPYTALLGFPERHEGLLAIMAYSVLFIAANRLPRRKHSVNMLLVGIAISAATLSLLGLFQFLGFDFMQSQWIQRVADPLNNINFESELLFPSGPPLRFGHAAYSTLYNPNTYGLYLAMVLPMAIFQFVYSTEKRWMLLWGAASCLYFINLAGTYSRGSYSGALMAVSLTMVLTYHKVYRAKKRLAVLFVIFLMLLFVMNSLSAGGVGNRLSSLITLQQPHSEDEVIDKIKNFHIEGHQLTIFTSETELTVIASEQSFLFLDEQNTEVPLNQDEHGYYSIDLPQYAYFEIAIEEPLIKIQKGKSYLYFAILNEEFVLLNHAGEVQQLGSVETLGFRGRERIGSGRGYIWSRSLPLLRNTVFIGNGPDTYALFFPQEDHLGKLNHMYDAYIIIDKPHNLYLQTAINTGVISLLAFVSIAGIFIISTTKNLFKQINKEGKGTTKISLQTSVFSAILGFLIAGFFTDSTVSVSPIFWILLGIGYNLSSQEEDQLTRSPK